MLKNADSFSGIINKAFVDSDRKAFLNLYRKYA